MSKGKGRSEGRKKKQREMNTKNEQEQPLMVSGNSLDIEMELQRRDQQIKSRYEKEEAKMREMHQRELQNMSDGIGYQVAPPKMPFWKRIFKREKDLFIVYNHNLPVYCHKKECPTKRSGVNWGIEAVVLDLETAFWYISQYFKEYGEYPWCNAKILHIKINRRNRRGAIVQDKTWKFGDWDESNLSEGIREMERKI